MLTSPFDVGSINRFDIEKFNKSEVVFVSDLFVEDYVGGAELTTQAIIDNSTLACCKIKSAFSFKK